jgi:hypothetical protein
MGSAFFVPYNMAPIGSNYTLIMLDCTVAAILITSMSK